MSRPYKVTKLEARVNKLGFSIEKESYYLNSERNPGYQHRYHIRLPSGKLSTQKFGYRDLAMEYIIEKYDEESMFLRFGDDLDEAAKEYEKKVKVIEKEYKKWGFEAV